MNGEVDCTKRVGRWRPLANWLLGRPGPCVADGVGVRRLRGRGGELVRLHIHGPSTQRFGDYLVAVLRYQWRVVAYLVRADDRYPGFTVVAGYVDPGNFPAYFYSSQPLRRRRLTVAFRAILVIPQAIALFFVNLAALIALVVGWFAVLITGHWPRGSRSFVVGWMRWCFRCPRLLVPDYRRLPAVRVSTLGAGRCPPNSRPQSPSPLQ